MIKSFYTAVNSASANQSYLDVISNNMSNIQTEGYKVSKGEFSELLYTNMHDSEETITNLKSGSGSKLDKIDTVFEQSAIFPTDIDTDFAIQGEGFFAVSDGQDIYFTRSGSFDITDIDGENYLTFQGKYVLDSNEMPIIIDNKDDAINVGVFKFDNNETLSKAGNNLYINNNDSEYLPDDSSTVKRGFLEASGVDMSTEMIKLIQTQRAFQFNSRIIQVADEIEQVINSLKG